MGVAYLHQLHHVFRHLYIFFSQCILTFRHGWFCIVLVSSNISSFDQVQVHLGLLQCSGILSRELFCSCSTHAMKLDLVLNMACRAITGCLKQSRVGDLYLLCGIAPPSMVRASFSQIVRTKHEGDTRHPYSNVSQYPRG